MLNRVSLGAEASIVRETLAIESGARRVDAPRFNEHRMC